MQQADVRVDPLDDLAVQLQDQAQHAVGRRVLRAEIDVELADRSFRNLRGVGGVVSHHLASAAFSSPGST